MIARSRSSSLFRAWTVSTSVERLAGPSFLEARDEARAEPGQCDVGVDLLEANLDMPPADPPTAGDVILHRRARKQIADPFHQGPLEPIDLGLTARDHFAASGWRSISA